MSLACLAWAPVSADAARKHKGGKKGKVPTLIYIAAEDLTVGEEGDASAVTEYWAAQTKGKKRRLLFTSLGGRLKVNRNGGWTPCCKRVYLLKDEIAPYRRSRLIQIGVDGRGEKRFARVPDINDSYSPNLVNGDVDVSERSGRVAYADNIEDGAGGGQGIWIMERNGARRQFIEVAEEWLAGTVAISPSGTAVAYSTGTGTNSQPHQVHVISHDGSNRRTIYQRPYDSGRPPLVEDFSGQGGRLLFVDGWEDPFTFDYIDDVFVANTLGFGADQLTLPGLVEEYPVFDPTATRIAFSDHPVGNTAPCDIFLMSSTGGNVRRFAHRRKRQLRPLMWINVRWERRKGTGR